MYYKKITIYKPFYVSVIQDMERHEGNTLILCSGIHVLILNIHQSYVLICSSSTLHKPSKDIWNAQNQHQQSSRQMEASK